MRPIALAFLLLAGCHHSAAPPSRPEARSLDMNKRQRFSCAMSNGNVYRDAYGQERCFWGPTQASTTTTCRPVAGSVECTTR
jgi:hypothetical protein